MAVNTGMHKDQVADDQVEKVVRRHGNGGGITLPKSWIGSRVLVTNLGVPDDP